MKEKIYNAIVVIIFMAFIFGLFYCVDLAYKYVDKLERKIYIQDSIYRDSLAGQVRIINEQERIIKSICKTPPVMTTKSYKEGKRKQDSIKQLKTK